MKIYSNRIDPDKGGGKKKKKGEAVHEYRAGKEYSGAVRDSQSVNKDYSGQPAPRVGGKVQKSSGMAKGTSSKRLIRSSKKNIKKSMASKAAKKAAIRQLMAKR